jgi:germination protein M
MAKKKTSRRKSSPERRHRGIGFLFWVCLIGIIVAVGFAARGSIKEAFSRLSSPHPTAAPTAAPSTPAPSPAAPTAPRVTISPLPDTARPARPTAPTTPPAAPTVDRPRATVTDAPATPAANPATRPTVRKARLFFVTVDPGGKLLVKSVFRPIPASDSPLHDTLEALLKGPTAGELNSGMLTMIPLESRLRSVTMSGDTAVVDFDQSFRFNAQGTEALNAQLRQVVYAATEFPNVKNVQVLIDGKKVRSLGTEGVRIDTPLSRSSFSQ